MKAIIWKELRENFKWAVLALLALTLAEIYALASGRTRSDPYQAVTLAGSSFLLVTSFGCALIGAAIGALQILPELRRDQWASLLHRPVSRSMIFLGKVAAGILLYLLATVPPFMASVAFVATPGQFAAPLVPGLLIPGLSDIGMGLVFYSLALLLCLHRQRWLGSRGAIALSILPAFAYHLTVGLPFFLLFFSAILLLLAGWGAILSNGPSGARPWITKVAMIAVIFMGCFAVFLLLGKLFQLTSRTTPFESVTFKSFRIFKDGKIFIFTQTGNTSFSLTDFEGNPVTDERYAGNDTGNKTVRMEYLFRVTPHKFSQQSLFLRRMYRNAFSCLRVANPFTYDSAEIWFHNIAGNYFVGYDKLSRRRAAFCSAMGYQPANATPSPFPYKLQTTMSRGSSALYWSGSRLYKMDFTERTMTVVYQAENDTIHGALNVAADFEKTGFTLILLSRDILLLDKEGKLVFSIPYSHDPAIWNMFQIGTNAAMDRLYVIYSPGFWWHVDSDKLNRQTYLDVIDMQGKVLQSHGLPAQISAEPSGWLYNYGFAILPGLPVALATLHKHFSDDKISSFVPQTLWPSFVVPKEKLFLVFGVSAVLAIVVGIWSLRVGFKRSQSLKWTLFVLLFGAPAFLAFRLASDWPTRVRCPQCGRPRQIDQQNCASCSEEWARPKASGTEVFDLASS